MKGFAVKRGGRRTVQCSAAFVMRRNHLQWCDDADAHTHYTTAQASLVSSHDVLSGCLSVHIHMHSPGSGPCFPCGWSVGSCPLSNTERTNLFGAVSRSGWILRFAPNRGDPCRELSVKRTSKIVRTQKRLTENPISCCCVHDSCRGRHCHALDWHPGSAVPMQRLSRGRNSQVQWSFYMYPLLLTWVQRCNLHDCFVCLLYLGHCRLHCVFLIC